MAMTADELAVALQRQYGLDAETARRRAVAALVQDAERYKAALLTIYAEAQRQVMRGERVTYTTASEPMGVRGGEITTRVGDLCDFRHAIENCMPWDVREEAIDTARAATPTGGSDAR